MFIKNKLANFIVLGGLALTVASCKKQLDTNLNNPNSITTNAITGKDVFAGALQNTVYNINAGSIATSTNQWMGVWARTTSYSASGTQYQLEVFGLNNAFGDNFWGSIYHNMLDYDFVASKSAEKSVLPGAAIVMKALLFQDLTDIFGDIPYSQALSAANITPAYDKAEDIYASLPGQLDSAMALLSASTSTGDDVADIMFKGDKTKWLAFANTVKLRVLLRQIPNASTLALQPELLKTASYGFLQPGVDASINPGYADATGQQSPFWASFGYEVGSTTTPKQNNTFYVANQTFVDYLTNTADPRLGYLFKMNKEGGYAGNFFGDFNTAKAVTKLSSIGSGILKSPSMDGVIMTASEALFLQAEAAERGLIPSVPYLPVFTAAVEESFRFLGVPDYKNAADAYIASSTDDRVNPAVSADPIKTIIYQKWVANAEIDGLETWSDYRRTGYPDRTNPSVNPGAGRNEIPKRMLYPQSETSQNASNYSAQKQVASDIYKKIFWGM